MNEGYNIRLYNSVGRNIGWLLTSITEYSEANGCWHENNLSEPVSIFEWPVYKASISMFNSSKAAITTGCVLE